MLLVLAVLVALAVWVGADGSLGRWVGDAAGSLLGLAKVFLPLLLGAAGIVLLRARADQAGAIARWASGIALLLAGGCGLAHLAVGPDTGSLQPLRGAGGLLGMGVAGPLRSLLASVGASLVLVLLVVAGVLVLARMSLKVAGGHALAGAKATVTAARSGVRRLAARRSGGGAGDAGDGPETGPKPFDDAAVTIIDPPVAQAQGGGAPDVATEAGLALQDPSPDGAAEVDPEQLAIDLGPGVAPGAWKLPPLALLKRSEAQQIDQKLVEEGGRTLEMALAAHGVETRLVGYTVGPTVTRYELELGPGVKVARVTSLNRDIAYAMASPDVRILAPIPGRSAIGVEVPNKQRQLVALGDILASDEARRATHPCAVAMGIDISGRAVMANLAEMPHILIAGATGAGKSSCINSLITSILVRSTPEQCRLILIDPKRVELGQYNDLPHLLTSVVVNPKKAANALSWAVKEMERRYDLLSEVGVRDITGYNAAFDRGDLRTEARVEGVDDPGEVLYKRLSFIVIVVDELNDLMMVAARDVEESICRIAQMARAVGIHLVLATQRPSVNVITGVIKANVPARLAFAVSSMTDSKVILDQGGAERLIGQGDMLLLGPASSNPRRIQGAWVGEDEVRKVVAHWKRQSPQVSYEHGVVAEGEDDPQSGLPGGSTGDEDDDELLWQAMELIVRSQLGSTSMLQRKLRVGFARAGRLMDLLEQKGVVGPSTGSKARDVLMTTDELDALQRSTAEV
ncbi:MAG: DNA translocase FtsK [uncultured Acidimicrobiales bacterium]|uniref:DNA translocase FtsK n=1 Tax=uncultured Acidimicrobiales bacterium TaxID=310071 RepID=A0A6J4HI35_9ACTN|nr:MAG: DNA translocase FtsK [uncultured Acidimicrobiales bacterium]